MLAGRLFGQERDLFDELRRRDARRAGARLMGSPNVPSKTSCRVPRLRRLCVSSSRLRDLLFRFSASLRRSGAFFGAASNTPMSVRPSAARTAPRSVRSLLRPRRTSPSTSRPRAISLSVVSSISDMTPRDRSHARDLADVEQALPRAFSASTVGRTKAPTTLSPQRK